MIFVTVGTHEQPFNRLIEAVDNLCETGAIDEPVIMQIGYSTYEPKHCEWYRLLPYDQMKANVANAHIVITHGGPASFIMPLQIGKIPVVVPRQLQFDEHVNNHQVDFVQAVASRMNNIIPVYDIAQLGDTIQGYDEIVGSMANGDLHTHNIQFNTDLEKIVANMFEEKES